MTLAIALGLYLVNQVLCINISTRSTDCITVMDICIEQTDLCRREWTLFQSLCDFQDGSCQIKSSKVCNMTMQSTLTHSPGWRVCLCPEEELCGTLQSYATQCLDQFGDQALSTVPSSAVKQRKSTWTTHRAQGKKGLRKQWEASGLLEYESKTNRSCMQGMLQCVQDEVCNKQMVPYVQACSANPCRVSDCEKSTKHFYRGLPLNVAEMLVFCDCEAGDEDCQLVKATLHSFPCDSQEEPWNCLEMLRSCMRSDVCRQLFVTFLSKCFVVEDGPDFETDASGWVSLMDLEYFHGEDKECRSAFVATMGSLLQHPCSCDGISDDGLNKCNMLRQTFQERKHFMALIYGGNVQHPPRQVIEPAFGHLWLNAQLLYLLVYILVAVVILLVTLIVFHKLGMHGITEKPRLHNHQRKTLTL